MSSAEASDPLRIVSQEQGEFVITTYGVRFLRKVWTVSSSAILGTMTHVETDHPVAALTFDDGPHPQFTPTLLDILKRYQARATFFMRGEAASKYPDIVRRVAEEGHAIGNHSWDHPSFPLIRGRDRRRQLRQCAAAISPYGGQRLFRPPYGHQSLASRLDALCLGYRVVTWNASVEDWWDRDADWMKNQLMKRIKAGTIVVLHDALYWSPQEIAPQEDRGPMLVALATALEQLKGRFRFVTIPELMQYGRPSQKYWVRSAPAELLPLLSKHPLVAQISSAHSG
jgi:peptidoglycan/xylan/chitin deacetylase (PgdA/CDA1 family)